MKKKYTYVALLIIFLSSSAFIIIRYELKNKPIAFYPLLERKGVQSRSAEWSNTKTTAENLIRIVRDNPDDIKNTLSLASLYIQEGRITGDHMYYDGAALKYVNDVLARQTKNFEALTLKSMIYLSQHHFTDGLELAEKAKAGNPYQAFVYGLLVDANVELGNYDSAVINSDRMVSIRPDIRSYSRIAYLREIHGDYPGAIEAMKMAVEAGGYGDETTEWTRIQLAGLYENTGDLKSAEMHYTIALEERPGYAYALSGLANIAMANKNYQKAISLFQQADSLVNDYSFKEQLAKVYFTTGNLKKGEEIIYNVIKGMNEEAKRGENDESIGHYADRELAYAYLMVNNQDKALQHALTEYNRRPNNIDVNETLAWVYYKKVQAEKAIPFINTALKTNCKNPILLCRAGLIYAKVGKSERAKDLLEQALKNDPLMDLSLKKEGADILKTL